MAHILIIDDDPTVGDVLMRMLTSEGHTVTTVVDGREGVDLINRQDIDLVIVDIFMPEKSGLEVIQEVKKLKPDLKMIAMTAFGAMDDIDMRGFAERYGAATSFEKPFERVQVLAVVNETLQT